MVWMLVTHLRLGLSSFFWAPGGVRHCYNQVGYLAPLGLSQASLLLIAAAPRRHTFTKRSSSETHDHHHQSASNFALPYHHRSEGDFTKRSQSKSYHHHQVTSIIVAL
eukprot:scaffold3666_cov132-Skeletonema_marinoi.AAC.1